MGGLRPKYQFIDSRIIEEISDGLLAVEESYKKPIDYLEGYVARYDEEHKDSKQPDPMRVKEYRDVLMKRTS